MYKESIPKDSPQRTLINTSAFEMERRKRTYDTASPSKAKKKEKTLAICEWKLLFSST